MSAQSGLLAVAALYSGVAISAQLLARYDELPLWIADPISGILTIGCFVMCWASLPVKRTWAKEPTP